MAQSGKKPITDEKKSRLELCLQSVDLQVANRDDAFDRMEAIKSF